MTFIAIRGRDASSRHWLGMEAPPWGLISASRMGRLPGIKDRGIADVASRQHGVITTAQLRFLGLDGDAITRRVVRGQLLPLHRGVYLAGPRPAPTMAPFAAAVLACGEGSLASHRAAISMWKLLPITDGPIDVLSTLARRRSRPGIRTHRTNHLEPWERSVLEGIPVTSPVRSVVDLAETATRPDVEAALNEARVRRLFTQREFGVGVQRARGRRGSGLLISLLRAETGADFSRSAAEDLLHSYIRAAGLPRPRRNLRRHGFELDFFWQELRLNVEVDGIEWHSTRDRVNSDRERDARLTAAGVQILRFTWDQLQREAETIARLAAAIAIAAERLRT